MSAFNRVLPCFQKGCGVGLGDRGLDLVLMLGGAFLVGGEDGTVARAAIGEGVIAGVRGMHGLTETDLGNPVEIERRDGIATGDGVLALGCKRAVIDAVWKAESFHVPVVGFGPGLAEFLDKGLVGGSAGLWCGQSRRRRRAGR